MNELRLLGKSCFSSCQLFLVAIIEDSTNGEKLRLDLQSLNKKLQLEYEVLAIGFIFSILFGMQVQLELKCVENSSAKKFGGRGRGVSSQDSKKKGGRGSGSATERRK